MERDATDNQMDRKERAYGKMERESSGMTNEIQRNTYYHINNILHQQYEYL